MTPEAQPIQPESKNLPTQREKAIATLAEPAVLRFRKGFLHGNALKPEEKPTPAPDLALDGAIATISTQERGEAKGEVTDWIATVDAYVQSVHKRYRELIPKVQNNTANEAEQKEYLDAWHAVNIMSQVGLHTSEENKQTRLDKIQKDFYDIYLGQNSNTSLFQQAILDEINIAAEAESNTLFYEEIAASIVTNPHIINLLNAFGTDAKELILIETKQHALEATKAGQQALEKPHLRQRWKAKPNML